MLHDWLLNHKIYKFHEIYRRVIYNDCHSSYDELLNLDNFVSVHHKNLQILATEMFRVCTGSATDIPNKVFSLKPPSKYKNSLYKTYENCSLWIEFFGIYRAENMGTATK